ncbi:DNA topoisomerase I [Halorhodospira halophila]|nr:DNA topoisomerase I [Halorhodospira halophila]
MLWYLVPAVVLVLVVRTPWFKGALGEVVINLLIRLSLDRESYHLIRNVTLPTADGTTQIDHIIVSVYGVFVVETKNMKGWIYGKPNQKTWTQKIYRHSRKFQNPLRQNNKHVRALQQLLDLRDDQVFSVVVFIGEGRFKTDMPDNVTYGRGVIRYIKSKKRPILPEDEVEKIIQAIEQGRLVRSIKTDLRHRRNVQERVSGR